MPVTDAYATPGEYRARVTKTDAGDDTTVIIPLLAAVSRLIDRETGRFYSQDAAAVVRLYDGNGLDRLYVDDIATLTGLVVKVDLEADFDFTGTGETLTRDTHYFVGPANAGLGSEAAPYRFLEIVPNNAVLGVWPEQPRSVQVTAQFGWPAVPGAIKEATVLIAREMRDLEESGMTLALENIDQAINLSRQAFSIMQRLKREYAKQELFV